MQMHPSEPVEGRSAERCPGAMLTVARQEQRCRVEEISPGAARVRVERQVPEGAVVMLELPGYGRVPAEAVVLQEGVVGLLFQHDGHAEAAMRRWLAA
jgi:hypothetical protein